MTQKRYSNIGGRFLIEPVGVESVFSRENFSDEHRAIEQMVTEFATQRIRPNKQDIEAFNKELSLQLLREMAELGLLGVDMPEQYGGMELDKITSAIVVEAMSRGYSASFTCTFSVQTGIGSLPIVWFGTAEQKQKYLPRLVTGEWLGAYALTEPSAGSDPLSGKTKAVLSDDGHHYILNGEKIFTTNGGWADVFIIFAQVDGSQFSAFIVDRDTPGLQVGAEEKKMGVKGSSTAPITLTDAKVPVTNLLHEVGQGATIAFNALNIGRLKLAAADLGGCKVVVQEAVSYAKERRQFSQPIAQFDVIKGKIADMVVRTYTSDSMIYRTVGAIQQAIDALQRDDPNYYVQMGEATERYAIEASMAKVVGSEALGYTTDQGIQIFGGYGFIEDYALAGMYRDTRIDRIWEGTNEINRQIVTGYMMKKALLEELPIRDAIRQIDDFLNSKTTSEAMGVLSAQAHAIETGKRLTLFLLHEALNVFGQDLKHEQQLTEIIANMLIDLYTADSTIARVRQLEQGDNPDYIPVKIAQVHANEACLRLLDLGFNGLKRVFTGRTSLIAEHLPRYQAHMLLNNDTIQLKRDIADYVYQQGSYPF